MKQRPLNIVMYSHDTYGLGHIRRTMAIAAKLSGDNTNIIILTGSPIAGRFDFPDHVDFVRIPGMIKKTNEEYLPLAIKINPRHALDIRTSIIKSTVKTFQPHLFIVDKEPLGLKKEIFSTLKWLRRSHPKTRTILGLRDILDERAATIQSWTEKNIYTVLDRFYDEIWIYGNQAIYDPVAEYAVPDHISPKVHFTGYLPRAARNTREARQERQRNEIGPRDKLVVVTAGGGGDGYPVMDTYLSMLESLPAPSPFKSILVTGPFMPKEERTALTRRARPLGIAVFHFYRQIEKLLAAADLVISMGGYNTVCELMSLKTLTLLIPRDTPRLEQTIRAECLHKQHLVDYIPWKQLAPEILGRKVHALLEEPQAYHAAMQAFEMTGFEVMRRRIRQLMADRA